MHFSQATNANGEPPARRSRTEPEEEEELHVKRRLYGSFPDVAVGEDGLPVDNLSNSALNSILMEHDRAHEHCGTESWTVKGRFGDKRRYGFSVTFATIAVVSDVNPPDEDSLLTHACVVNWSITDHHTNQYYRFSEMDPRAASLLSMMIAKRALRDQPSMTQAVLEQLNSDRLVLPDELMGDVATTRLTEMDLQYDKNTLKRVTPPKQEGRPQLGPAYELRLSGTSFETVEKDLNKEVKATLELTFYPRRPPTPEGDRGIVSNGWWEEDEYCYCVHHSRVVSGSLRITRASDGLELARELDLKSGDAWYEHRFGGAVARTKKEAVAMRLLRKERLAEETAKILITDRALIRLFTREQDSISVSRLFDAAAGKTLECTAVVQSATAREAFQYAFTKGDKVEMIEDAASFFRSPETGCVFPLKWALRAPTHDGKRVELTVTATLDKQEFITVMAQPSAWDGAVTATGKLFHADGTEEVVSGDGYVTCRGRGKIHKGEAVFDTIRSVAIAPLETLQGTASMTWDAIADDPVLPLLVELRRALLEVNFELTDSQLMVLAAFLGTYHYISHHSSEKEKVKKALVWCYTRWMTFFGTELVNYRTLTIRAFMMTALRDLLQEKCASWVPKYVEALDVAVPTVSLANSEVGSDDGLPMPTKEDLVTPPTDIELSQCKALMEGVWVMDPESTEGSMDALLLEQGVSVLWRCVNNNAEPTWEIDVDTFAKRIQIEEESMLERRFFTISVTGTEYRWESVSRGALCSRACLLSQGRVLYVETEVSGGGMERVWYEFPEGGKEMTQSLFYYRSGSEKEPVASCKRRFKLELPPGSPGGMIERRASF